MATPIKMPDVGTTVEEIKLVRWLKKEGEDVRRGEALAEIETDKATFELESAAQGTLLRRLADEGQLVCQGEVIAYVGQPDEVLPDQADRDRQTQPEPVASAGASAISNKASENIRVSPMVRKLAEKTGVDLASIKGTGPNALITRQDVLSAGQAAGQATAPKHRTLSSLQAKVAKRVAQSHTEIPVVHFTTAIDMTEVINLREKVAREKEKKLTYDSFFLYAVSRILKDFPLLRSVLDGETIVEHCEINLGLALSVEESLFLPVIKQADKKSVEDISRQVETLVEKASSSSLTPEDMADGCFMISNLGMYPVETFDAIIAPQQSAALAIASITKTAVAIGDALEIRPICHVTLSVDHRLINGRMAGEFLKSLKSLLEAGQFKGAIYY